MSRLSFASYSYEADQFSKILEMRKLICQYGNHLPEVIQKYGKYMIQAPRQDQPFSNSTRQLPTYPFTAVE